MKAQLFSAGPVTPVSGKPCEESVISYPTYLFQQTATQTYH